LARQDPAWAAEGRWGGMVRMLVRDIASADRKDPLFPFLRNWDAYEGHTWASGHARFGDGNNNESSSEAMNAWIGLILWADSTGDRKLRDLGIYLYTTEMEAIDNYWFDVEGKNRPSAFPGSTVAMVWGGKAVPATWFSGEPEKIHGINWLPFQGGSLYLGRYPQYVKRNYDALLKEAGGPKWGSWASYVLMYEALTDPADALRQFEAKPAELPIEEGNSRANVYHWLHSLNVLGQVDRAITADTPLYAVFRKGGKVTHVAYNAGTQPRTVRFSDGKTLTVSPGRLGIDP
jgi:endoglucanase Acf2